MAHIISCMLDLDDEPLTSLKSYIANPSSPQCSNDKAETSATSATSTITPEKPFVWRMAQPERKYQLFPKDKQMNVITNKGLDPEQAFAHAMSQQQNGDTKDKAAAGNGLRLRIKEHNLNRRRKVSVPELGPMTTVQEVAMDSPTIPGRPPLHERSISAPQHSWRQHHLVECMTSSAVDEIDELEDGAVVRDTKASKNATLPPPSSPRSLAPLVIPANTSPAPRLACQVSLSRLRAGASSANTTMRSAKTEESPMTKTPFTPYTPLSAFTAATTSTLPTPVSAPAEARASPQPWSDRAFAGTPRGATPDLSFTRRAELDARSITPLSMGHRRNQSESALSGSIMERGRPRKRKNSRDAVTGLSRSASKRSKSAERRAFETLPKGWTAEEATTMMSPAELAAVQKQALQQAARFEVLRKEDVDSLSKELRTLDERTEYLRRTYTSLRAGRRNLHTRICQYLGSPRTAKFSHESMLKQEEALADLDASIDDWVNKLEQAENRRTRVRQKLLEHVAAATTLACSSGDLYSMSGALQLAMGVKPCGLANISTPPRSPVKETCSPRDTPSPSPQRVVAHVPSTIIEQPAIEEATATTITEVPVKKLSKLSILDSRRIDVESIRIYAGDDVYALLADVENEFSKMGSHDAHESSTRDASGSISDEKRKELHRAQSHELLSGRSQTATPTPSTEQGNSSKGEVLLSNAVFQP